MCRWKINESQNQWLNLLLACALNQIVQTLVSAEYFQWSALMCVNVEGFVETLFMIQSKVIMMRLKRTMKMIMLTTIFRIFDVDYQMLCVKWLACLI